MGASLQMGGTHPLVLSVIPNLKKYCKVIIIEYGSGIKSDM